MGQRFEFLRLRKVSNTLPALRCPDLLLAKSDTPAGGDDERRGLGYFLEA